MLLTRGVRLQLTFFEGVRGERKWCRVKSTPLPLMWALVVIGWSPCSKVFYAFSLRYEILKKILFFV